MALKEKIYSINSNDIGVPINKESLIDVYQATRIGWIQFTFLIPVIG